MGMKETEEAQRALRCAETVLKNAKERRDRAGRAVALAKHDLENAEASLKLHREREAGPALAKALDKVLRLFADNLLAEGVSLTVEQASAREEALAIFEKL